MKNGLAKGFIEFSIIGTDLGSYGKDIGTDLLALLKQLIAEKGNHQIRLRNVHPQYIIEKMKDLEYVFRSGKITYFESAAQTGNNRILKLMNRSYTIENYKKAILNVNEKFLDIKIRTQLMVGFPGETDEEFQDTLNLLDEVSFDFAEVYQFSPRPNTNAFNLITNIPKKVVEERYYKLIKKSLSNQTERKQIALKEYKEGCTQNMKTDSEA